MKQKIQTLLNQLNHGLVEREDTLKTALLTVLAGENLVLIGPPGTGKSLIARRIADSFAHSSAHGYFEYLLTKFSTPEEIFGPLSITELKADRFKRNTAGYLPTVKMAFLDEIFKASSSILNALLTILNERIYHNGAEPQAVPMQALIAASNELPNDQEELGALYDRFLVRRFVDYVSEDNLPRLFDNAGTMPALTGPTQLTTADLNRIKDSAQSVTLPDDIRQAMQRIWAQHKETFKEDRRESLSDRRLKKVIQLLCVSAATNGRSQVDLSDVFLLKDCLWNHQDNAIKVRDLILSTLRSFSHPVPQNGDLQPLALQNGLLTYEVAQDGKSLTPATPQTAVRVNVSSALAQSNARRSTVVKGFKGSGTAQDPLLIQTVEDLMDLSRPDVGLKGYYFRQTADIDCTALNSWMDIPFQGHYDGGGYTIQYKKIKTKGECDLFSSIQAQSSITRLNLKDLRLATTAEHSHITQCTGSSIRENAANCIITACESRNSLIGKAATDCTISTCKSGDKLVSGSATYCTITDCESSNSLIGKTTTDCTISTCKSGAELVSGTAANCTITGCESSNSLIGKTATDRLTTSRPATSARVSNSLIGKTATDCTISTCKSGAELIFGTATSCTISACESGAPLISEVATYCAISDCLAVLNEFTGYTFGGIAKELTQGSVIERCFVTGTITSAMMPVAMSGIAANCSGGIIRQCALGRMELSGYLTSLQGRIISNGSVTLENNAAIDTNPGTNNSNGCDGRTVAAAMFKQRYFENTLGWNFDSVWQWDDANDRPTLRSAAASAASQSAQPAAQAANMTDLLTQQMRANLWL